MNFGTGSARRSTNGVLEPTKITAVPQPYPSALRLNSGCRERVAIGIEHAKIAASGFLAVAGEPLLPSKTGAQFGTHVRIKNVGSITVYNASVRAAMAMVMPMNTQEIWTMLDPAEDGTAIAPGEIESISIGRICPTLSIGHLSIQASSLSWSERASNTLMS